MLDLPKILVYNLNINFLEVLQMKKLVSLLLSMLLLFSCSGFLLACGGDNSANSNTEQTTCSHNYIVAERKATCSKGGYATYECSICSDSYQEYEAALGHTTNSGTCLRCGQKLAAEIWESAFYVDEFNNPTNQAYIRNTDVFVGTFSNSATTNSKLYARILIDAEDIAIKLWEYGSLEVNAYSTTYYDITLLDDNGNKHYTNGTMYKNGERIYFKDWTFASLLQQNQKLKVYIVEDSKYGYNSSYLFEVENGNFNTVYSNFYK